MVSVVVSVTRAEPHPIVLVVFGVARRGRELGLYRSLLLTET